MSSFTLAGCIRMVCPDRRSLTWPTGWRRSSTRGQQNVVCPFISSMRPITPVSPRRKTWSIWWLRYSHLDVCLDIGHVRVGAEMLNVDEWDVVQTLAPHTRSMHLWTTRGREDVRRYHHVPVHPTLTAANGWIDIPRLLDLVLPVHPDCAIVFEPDNQYCSDPAWQAQGMDWVRQLVAPYRSRVPV